MKKKVMKKMRNLKSHLHAIGGNVGSSTMRVHGKIKSAPVIILIDSGSTDNFMSSEVVSKLQLKMDDRR